MENNNIISLKNDLAFKRAFSDKNNVDMLQDLLASILDVPYESIENINIKNTELVPKMENEKYSILDINLSVDGRLINIEMQVAKESYFKDRTLYYWAKLFTSELKKSEDYGNLQQTVCINFLDFNIFDYEKYHSIYELKEREYNNLLTDKCQIHFLELKKYKKQYPSSHLEMWLQLINARTQEDLEILGKSNSTMIKKAVTVIMEMSADERLKEEIRVREKALLDELSRLNEMKRIKTERENIEKELKEMSNKLEKKSDELKKTSNELEKTSNELEKKSSELEKTSNELEKTSDELEKKSNELEKTSNELEKVNKKLEKKEQKAIKDLISLCKDFGASIAQTVSKLMEKNLLTEEEAREYVLKYWEE